MIRVKICGITSLNDALLVSQLGAWAAGFIFYKNSPRFIEPEEAKEIIKSLPDSLEKIGVFVNSSISEIKNIALSTEITQIQLHGNESGKFCVNLLKELNLPIIKAISVKNIDDLSVIAEYKDIVSSILLDTYSELQYGGTGKPFDWNIAKYVSEIPVILAGGINPDNIIKAYSLVQPYAFDISSGVEKKAGIKDHDKLREIFSKIKEIR